MINWKDIDLKGRKSGTVSTICPACSHTRKKKKDPCLSVNIDKGAAKCHHCDEISWREPLEETKTYEAPSQEWQNFTSLSDKVVQWFKNRGISQRTLIRDRITEERHYQPQLQKEVQNIVFNYFEGSKLLNKKYRGPKKTFTQTKNAKKVFYGINDIVDAEEVYIVEGEIDKLSLTEISVFNAVSVPNGANDLNDIFETCERHLKHVKQFFIAVDMDEQGQKLEQELIKRLGKYRCKRVNFERKDANEDLIAGCLEKSLKNLTEYPVEGTFTAEDVISELHALRDNGIEAPMKPKGEKWRELNDSFSVLPGQLTVVTGIPGHGKSNIIEEYVISLVNDLKKVASFYSPEHLPMQLHHSQLAEKVIGKPYMEKKFGVRQISHEEIDQYKDWSKGKIYLTMPEKAEVPTWDWIFERFEEQIFRYGVDIFVIDAFNKVKRGNPDSLGEINEALARLVLFCQMHNVNVFLIAHPTKMKKNEDDTFQVPTLYDVKGSGDFFDQAHNGVTIYRHFEEHWTEWVTTKLKFKHQGEVATRARFEFERINGRYRPFGTESDFHSILEEKQEVMFQQPVIPNQDDSWLDINGEDAKEDLPY